MIDTLRFGSATARKRYAILIARVARKKDCWAEWLADMRSCADPDVRAKGLEMHASWQERILGNANLTPGETVLDVGCGEGLIAFGALERGAEAVVFSDISQDLLDFCRQAASELGLLDRCRFVRASADDLAPIGDASVDVVTTRSVLIFVADKHAAFEEFSRVLRPGGRISLFEPINRFGQTDSESWAGFDLSPIPEIARKLRAVYDAIQPPDRDPMLDFDERDLIAFAEQAGFHPIQLELEAEIRPSEPMQWETFISRAGNPRIPPIGEVLGQALTSDERDELTAYLRPLVEEGRGTWRMAIAYLHAVKT
jgi:ubiquinone/menaquinone biosynthesis C-methylase UbiE